jgi:hypothetical protein
VNSEKLFALQSLGSVELRSSKAPQRRTVLGDNTFLNFSFISLQLLGSVELLPSKAPQRRTVLGGGTLLNLSFNNSK